MIDSHCHLQALEPDDCERALDAARERGVEGFLVPAIQLRDAERLLDLCRRHADVWCALGVHPHEASTWQQGDAARLSGLFGEECVVAVGECGLDFHYDHSPREVQERVLREQWALAVDSGLPAVVHNRSSDAQMRSLVEDPAFAELRADFHSYAGDDALHAAVVNRGFAVGVSGMVTFKTADNIRDLARRTPPELQLIETDTPYLAPVPHRGKPNRPAYVAEVLTGLAAALGETAAEVEARTNENFYRTFPKARVHRA